MGSLLVWDTSNLGVGVFRRLRSRPPPLRGVLIPSDKDERGLERPWAVKFPVRVLMSCDDDLLRSRSDDHPRAPRDKRESRLLYPLPRVFLQSGTLDLVGLPEIRIGRGTLELKEFWDGRKVSGDQSVVTGRVGSTRNVSHKEDFN